MFKFFTIIFMSIIAASALAWAILSTTKFRFKSSNRRLQELDDLLDLLVRRKMLEFGFFKHFKNKQGDEYEVISKCRTLKLLEHLILKNKNAGKSNNHLLSIYDFLNSVHERKISRVKNLKDALEKYTRSPISSIFILDKAQILLNTDMFLIDEEKESFSDLKEINSILRVYVYMSLIVEDAIKGSLTASKAIERMNNTSGKKIFKAVEYLVLLKTGASSKILMDEIIHKQNFEVGRLKRMADVQKHNAIMAIIRKGARTYKTPIEITSEILNTLKKMNKLRNEYLNENFREDKREQQRANKQREERERKRKEDTERRNNERRQKARAESNDRRKHQEKKESKPRVGGILSDAYKTLGVDPNCSIRKLKKSYKSLAMKKHPDRLHNLSSESEKRKAHDEFIEIKNAYDKILKNKKAA